MQGCVEKRRYNKNNKQTNTDIRVRDFIFFIITDSKDSVSFKYDAVDKY